MVIKPSVIQVTDIRTEYMILNTDIQDQDIRLTLGMMQHQEHQHQQHKHQGQYHVVMEVVKVIQDVIDTS